MMSSKPKDKSQRIQYLIKNLLRVIRNPWVRTVIIVTTLFFAFFYVFRQYESIKVLLIDGKIQFPKLALSNIFVLGVVYLGSVLWWLILSGFSIHLGILKAARIHVISTLAKYIPGVVWQFSGKTYLSFTEGVPVKIAGLSMVLEVGLSLLSGMGITLLLAPLVNPEILPLPRGLVIFLQMVGVILLVLVIASPWITARVLKSTIKANDLSPIPAYWLSAVLIIIAAWLMLSAALYFLTSSLGLPGISFLDCILVICGSYMAGILVFFVPNGIVVREAVMVALLPLGYDAGAALLLSIVSRLQVVFGEILLGLFIVGLIGSKNRKSRESTDQE